MKEFDIEETGMFVPKGFFDKFQEELEAKIDQMEAEKLDIIAAKKRQEAAEKKLLLRRWSIAACTALLIGISPFVWKFMNQQTASPEISNLAMVESTQASDIESEDEMMVFMVSDLDIYENFYADL